MPRHTTVHWSTKHSCTGISEPLVRLLFVQAADQGKFTDVCPCAGTALSLMLRCVTSSRAARQHFLLQFCFDSINKLLCTCCFAAPDLQMLTMSLRCVLGSVW